MNPENTYAPTAGSRCQMCGARAAIHIISDPARRHGYHDLCRNCARFHHSRRHRCERSRLRAELAVYFGLILAVVPLLADHFPLDASWSYGYGWLVSIVPGVVIVGAAAAFSVRSLLLAGAIWLILLGQATWLPLSTLPAFAWWRMSALLFGSLMIAGGIVLILQNRALQRGWRSPPNRRTGSDETAARVQGEFTR